MSLLDGLEEKLKKSTLSGIEQKLKEKENRVKLEDKKKQILLKRSEHYSSLFKIQNYLTANSERILGFNLDPLVSYLDESFQKLVELEAIASIFNPVESMSASDALNKLSPESKKEYITEILSPLQDYFAKELEPYIQKTKDITDVLDQQNTFLKLCDIDPNTSSNLVSTLVDSYNHYEYVLSNPYLESERILKLKTVFLEAHKIFMEKAQNYVIYARAKERGITLPDINRKPIGIEIA